MFGIPGPPLPELAAPVAYGAAAGCLAIGTLSLLWGRNLGRALLCAVGMAAGLVLAGPVAERLSLNLTILRLVATVAVGAIGLVLARLIWALLGGVIFGVLAECIALAYCMEQIAVEQRPVFQPADATFAGWVLGVGKFHLAGLYALWGWKMSAVLATIVPAVAFPLVLGLVRGRLGRIVMTSITGAAAVVSGPVIALAQLSPSLWTGVWTYWYVPLIIAGSLALIGLAVQYRGALEADKSQAKREAEPPEKSQKK